jgi:PAS domain S-box-containing protein
MVARTVESHHESDVEVPIVVWRVDGPDLRLEGYNHAAEEATRGGIGPMVGRSATDLLGDSPEVLEILERCRDGHTVLRHHVRNYVFRTIARQADMEFTCTWVPPDRVALAALEEPSEPGPPDHEGRFLASMIASLPANAFAYRCRNDRTWSILYISEGCESLTGYRPAELVRKVVTYDKLIHEDDREQVATVVREALAAGRLFQVTYRIRSKSGDIRWVWDSGRGVGISGQSLIEGLVLDVTEAHNLEEKLRQAEGNGTARSASAPAAPKVATVLLVEDEAPLREAARRALTHLGYHVVSVSTAEEALSRLESGGVDVVVSDLALPRKSGADLLKAVRRKGGNTPFLLMTGYDTQDVPDWKNLSRWAVLLHKPWTVLELAQAVREAIAKTA